MEQATSGNIIRSHGINGAFLLEEIFEAITYIVMDCIFLLVYFFQCSDKRFAHGLYSLLFSFFSPCKYIVQMFIY